MSSPFPCRLLIALLLFSVPYVAQAVNPAHWLIMEQLTRGESTKIWTSPTAIDLDKMLWEYDYEITKVTGTVNVPVLGDITEDITNSIPADIRFGSGDTRDLPAILLDDTIVEPETGTSADVLVEINDSGFGREVFSNIVLGSANVPLFGSRPIQRVNIEARVDIVGYDVGDYNRNGAVDAADYAVWRDTHGQSGLDLAADGDANEQVDAGDYQLWRSHFGQGASGAAIFGSSATHAVPEPASSLLLLGVLVAAQCTGRGRNRQRTTGFNLKRPTERSAATPMTSTSASGSGIKTTQP